MYGFEIVFFYVNGLWLLCRFCTVEASRKVSFMLQGDGLKKVSQWGEMLTKFLSRDPVLAMS